MSDKGEIIDGSYVETVSGKYPEGYAIEEYRGEVGIVVAKEWNGKIYSQWGYRQIGKKDEKHASDKALPIKIFLGDRSMAIRRLLEMAVLLGWQPKTGTIIPKHADDNMAADGQPELDIPF